MTSTGVEIGGKLCLTAAFVGAMTRKELAAAFYRANPRTSFDIERAHKWIQGRANPRERALYDDWALVLGGGRTADWIADCALADFIDEICADGTVDRGRLLRRAEAFAGEGRSAVLEAANGAGPPADLIGVYACYSHAWSPYFPDRIVRGALVIERDGMAALRASYAEALPNGPLRTIGRPRVMRHALYLDLFAEDGSAGFPMMLYPPTTPARVLGGLMSGVSVLSSEPGPSVTRIAMFRLGGPEGGVPAALLEAGAYLEPGGSIAGDLTALGARIEDAAGADRAVAAFLGEARADGAMDRAPAGAYRDLVSFFDGEWARRASL